MANLDTVNKRRSAIGILGLMTVLPLADGAVGQPDRQQACGMYCCIAASGLVATDKVGHWMVIFSRALERSGLWR